MPFELKLNATTTGSTVTLDQALALETSGAETLGTNIATAQITTDLNSWFSLEFDEGENPAVDNNADVTYKFDATKTSQLFAGADAVPATFAGLGTNAMANWHLLETGAHTDVSGYGWANRAPLFGVPDTTDAVSGDAAIVNGTDISLHESILPKRILACYGANVTELLANEAAIAADSQAKMMDAINAFVGAFAASQSDKSAVNAVGYKLWTQAVKAATDEDASADEITLTDRINDMVNTNLTSDGAGTNTVDFVFAANDSIELELIVVGAGAEPETTGDGNHNSRGGVTLNYRLKLVQQSA